MANMPEKNVKEACRLNQIDTCLDSWHRVSWIGQSESLLAVSGAVLFYPFLLCFSQDIWHFSCCLMAWRPRPLSAQAKLHGVNVSLMDSSFESRIFQVAMGFYNALTCMIWGLPHGLPPDLGNLQMSGHHWAVILFGIRGLCSFGLLEM